MIVLGLALVLGFASAASAVDVDIFGDVTMGGNLQWGHWEWNYPCCYPLGYHLFLKASDTFGNASADVTFGITYEDYFGVADANVIYHINDVLYVGLKYVGEDPWSGYSNYRYCTPAVMDEYNDANYGNCLDYDDAYTVVGTTFDKGAVAAYWELEDGDLYAGGHYSFGQFEVGGGLWYSGYSGHLDFFDIYGKYAISDNLAVAGEYMGNYGDDYLGFKAEYTAGRFGMSGAMVYELSSGDFERLLLEGTYQVTDKLSVIARYNSNLDDCDPLTWEEIGGLSVGAAYQVSPALRFECAYYLEENRFDIEAGYTFYFG